LLVILFVVDIISSVQEKNISGLRLNDLFIEHLRMDLKNVLFIVCSVAICFIFLGGLVSASALNYTRVGIGMLHISTISFYWYAPVLLSSSAIFLVYCRKKLGDKYVSLGLFIIVLAIGNSMYFFGRSHENNILSASALLVFVLFILFDVIIFTSPGPQIAATEKSNQPAKNKKSPEPVKTAAPSFFTQKNIATYLPVVFIVFFGFYYSERIIDKTSAQYANFKESQFHLPLLPPMDMASIKKITHNSQKVYFLDHLDFYYCYYGDYAPQGYFSPLGGWLYKKDLQNLLQDLLSKGFYIVYDDQKFGTYNEYFPYLKYNHTEKASYLVSLKYDSVKALLPADNSSLLHVEINDTLIREGMDRADINFKESFTIETIIKPFAPQPPNAAILNNLTRYDGPQGLTFQRNGTVPNSYVFAICNGTNSMPNAVFQLDDNRWHYIAITVNKDVMKVFDNGKLLATVNVGGVPAVNSEVPLTIGNMASRDAHFNGFIREVKISNGNISDAEITNTGQKLDAELNTVK
jgi:hypothetical protein